MRMVGVAVIMQTTPTVLFAAVDSNSVVHARDVNCRTSSGFRAEEAGTT